MNAMHQYMLDNYRAAQRGDQAPPQPGLHDVRVVREFRDYRHFQAVVSGRRARGRARAALARWLHRRPRRAAGCR
ncbi:hypothetical protein [Streptomyces sp.]|uniref:hypothetical protein n=1 Tax=Streptomyces sp. TaxID=1931 RepID=UPI002D786FEC|nr:hypothetical protein [Streptomyces sp.]HET6355173.1 hypothetical protein [Streptomyces sp.]